MTTEKVDFWQDHIDAWKRSGISQKEYCSLNNLSPGNFSKWKKKLAPAAKPARYKAQNKYAKFTKLSNTEFEKLVLAFFEGEEITETESKTGVSARTIADLYRDLQDQVISNALIYPHLFFHAGTLLLLGPPPDAQERLDFYKDTFAFRKSQVRSNETPEGQLRNNIEITFRLLVNFMSYEWSLAECFVFRELGLQIYYEHIYAKEHDTDPYHWDDVLYKQLVIETNLVNAFKANMDYWAIERKGECYLFEEAWNALFKNRTRRMIDKTWAKNLAHDLLWALKNSPIKGRKKLRSGYWDEYRPDDSEIDEVKVKLFSS